MMDDWAERRLGDTFLLMLWVPLGNPEVFKSLSSFKLFCTVPWRHACTELYGGHCGTQKGVYTEIRRRQANNPSDWTDRTAHSKLAGAVNKPAAEPPQLINLQFVIIYEDVGKR